MRTLEVIRTIRWIDSLFPELIKEVLLNWTMHKPKEDGPSPLRDMDNIIHELNSLGDASGRISRNAAAVEVIKAFNLDPLLDGSFMSALLKDLMIPRREEAEDESCQLLGLPYTQMVSTVRSWEALTTPPELTEKRPPEGLLTLNIRPPSPRGATVAVLSRATALLNDLYDAMAEIHSKKPVGRLEIVKVESGTTIRVDCKGAGDVVKHVKDLFLESWHKVRHKRAEEVIEKNKALLSTLEVIDRINSQENRGGLSPEGAEALRRRVLKDVIGLFECGALIAEIPFQEEVDNTRLLGGFAPKLLPAPGEVSSTKKGTGRGAAKKVGKRRATRKRSPNKSANSEKK